MRTSFFLLSPFVLNSQVISNTRRCVTLLFVTKVLLLSTFGLTSKTAAVMMMKHRILCLHGKNQSGSMFSNKIGGARRKLARVYELDFLDGPIELSQQDDEEQRQLAWWLKNEQGEHIHVQEGLDYVMKECQGKDYRAIIGFSQGGALATALALTGVCPNLKAVVTAGSPCVMEVFDLVQQQSSSSSLTLEQGRLVPKLHTWLLSGSFLTKSIDFPQSYQTIVLNPTSSTHSLTGTLLSSYLGRRK